MTKYFGKAKCKYIANGVHYFNAKTKDAKYCCVQCYYNDVGYVWRDYRHQPKSQKSESQELVSAVLEKMVEKRIEERFGKTFLSILNKTWSMK